jgi:hypothetical protein
MSRGSFAGCPPQRAQLSRWCWAEVGHAGFVYRQSTGNARVTRCGRLRQRPIQGSSGRRWLAGRVLTRESSSVAVLPRNKLGGQIRPRASVVSVIQR